MKLHHRFPIALALTLVFLALSCQVCLAKTVYVKTTGLDTNDGLSWDTAKKSLWIAIRDSAPGDEIWVAAGTYVERITLKAGTGLYGGFSGTESSRDQRNWKTYVTGIDGNLGYMGDAVISPTGATASTVIDGVSIRNRASFGSLGYGIRCSSSSPTITNNTITDCSGGVYCNSSSPTIIGNTIANNGGGISCTASSPMIARNIITANTAGGIGCDSSSSPIIANNTIRGNGSTGVSCDASSSPTVTNNTICGNGAPGVLCADSSFTVSNNVIAFNYIGVRKTGTTGIPVLRNNCIFGNLSSDYSDLSAGTGDISVDPMLASRALGSCHIQPSSPCRNAGWSGAPGLQTTDIDGQDRVQDGAVDIGSDESNGTTWTVAPVVVRVTPNGSDANDGSSWALAKKTVQAAAMAASAAGGEVWVAAGTYNEHVALLPYASLYGGFVGTESSRAERDWKTNRAILDGGGSGEVVSVRWNVQPGTIDGLTIQNGAQGIVCYVSSPVITNNTITGNKGSGIASMWLSSPGITNNIITGNSSVTTGGGIHFQGTSSSVVANNVISWNSCSSGGGIVFAYGTEPAVTVTNNTIVGNSAYGIFCRTELNSGLVIMNNIIAFSTYGMYYLPNYTIPTTRNNCVFNPGGTNYGLGVLPGQGDISADPKFVSSASGEVHLEPFSPCADAGYDGAVQAGWTDIDGQARIQGLHVDIGADECRAIAPPVTLTMVRVSPTGNDAYDGSTWDLAKKTVRAGVEAVAPVGGEVWVRAGTYSENLTLSEFVYLYGGFAGTELSRDERNWKAYTTILDGGNVSNILRIASVYKTKVNTVDGFTIRNGNSADGGGIYCGNTSPSLTNLTVSGCAATNGGGIYCANSYPSISNTTITTCTATNGGGISCAGGTPSIANSTINGCSAANGGGIYSLTASPSISNNTINGCTATLGGGIYFGTSGGTISANTISGNTATDGGGIYDLTCTGKMLNNILRANSAARGGGIYSKLSTNVDKFMNNTLVENIGTTNGGGVYSDNTNITMGNNIIAFNQRGVYVGAGAAPTFRNNCVSGNTTYNYSGIAKPSLDISADPKFVNRVGGDYHVLSTSQCIDWGTQTDAPSVDRDGAFRPQDGNTDGRAVCDIGVYEYPFYLAKAKNKLVENSVFAMIGTPVTAVFPSEGRVYLEMPDRSAGIRVDTAQTLSEGQVVNLTGNIHTDAVTGERYVTATAGYPQSLGSNMILAPFALKNAGLGGGILGLQDGVWSWDSVKVPGDGYIKAWVQSTLLNNIGLLVTTFGNVTYADTNYLYVDDGSGTNDASGHLGVKVVAAGLTFPSTGMVKVTGISSCEKNAEGKIVRLLRVRKQADIVAY